MLTAPADRQASPGGAPGGHAPGTSDDRPPSVLHVVGARPNYMKVAPVLRAFGDGVRSVLVHTGQHYDTRMSDVFFQSLGLPDPDFHLRVGSGSHAEQTARVMERLDPVLELVRPRLVLVVGDVNSTLAAALTCAKRHVPVAHVEAGLRSHDWSMPEEVNRVLTDHLSTLLFTTCRDADENLAAEGITGTGVRFVGNTMIDSLDALSTARAACDVERRLGLRRHAYAVVTLHRPANVDDRARLLGLVAALRGVAQSCPVVFPVHSRTRARLAEAGLADNVSVHERLLLTEPLDYLDFTALVERSRLVLTDSGGIQEETTVFGVPCLTLRPSTERPITVTAGTNRLVDPGNPDTVVAAAREAMEVRGSAPRRPELWDGQAGARIAAAVIDWLQEGRESDA